MKSQTIPNIALSGKSGAGKTTIAKFLEKRFNYVYCSSGEVCRKICQILFGSIEKTKMNALTTVLRELDPLCLIQAGIRNSEKEPPHVFDSIRFKADYEYAKKNNYIIIRIECDAKTRWKRLYQREEVFNEIKDESDLSETDLDEKPFDIIIDNSEDRALDEVLLNLENELEKIFKLRGIENYA